MANIYSGTLFFDDDDVLEVHRLVVRDGELAFDISVTWGDSERWKTSLVAKELDDGAFQSPKSPTRSGAREGPLCEFWCVIVQRNSRRIELEGRWIENDEYYDFKGELESVAKSELR